MALKYIDGFDAYPTADITKRWTNPGAFSGFTVASSSGRNSTGCLSCTSQTTGKYLLRSLGGNYTSGLFVGMAFSISALPSGATPVIIFALLDNTVTFTNNVQLMVGVTNTGDLVVYKYAVGSFTQLGLYAAGITISTFYFIELKAASKTSISAGDVKLYLNGTLVITVATASNTNPEATGNMNTLMLGFSVSSVPSTTTVLWDDLYIADNTGSQNNDVLGDIRVETIRPTGAGTTTQLTPSSGSNYAAVNEAAEDGDSSYVSTSTVGQLDTYAMGDLVSTPLSVKGIQVNTTARKDDAGTRSLGSVVRSGGANYDHGSSNPYGLADSYTTQCDLWELDPNGSIAWTGTSVNALEAGVKLVS